MSLGHKLTHLMVWLLVSGLGGRAVQRGMPLVGSLPHDLALVRWDLMCFVTCAAYLTRCS
jgi:hypothetical protein